MTKIRIWFRKFTALACKVTRGVDTYMSPILLLIMRLWMANIFFKSGRVKIQSFSTTIDLFQNEYKTPFVDPIMAAMLSTAIELTAPIFLAIGLATRIAAIPMFIMVVVIQLTYLQLNEHYYWMMILGLLILKGPGAISLDHWIAKFFCKKTSTSA